MPRELDNIKNISAIVIARLELYSQLVAVESRIAATLLVRRLAWLWGGMLFMAMTVAMIHAAVIAQWRP